MMKKNIVLSLIFSSVFLFGCSPAADTKMYEQSKNLDDVQVDNNDRITVTRIGVFADNLAYNDRRGIYIVKDNNTGIEYVGISGIGISSLGSHMAGKVHVTDER